MVAIRIPIALVDESHPIPVNDVGGQSVLESEESKVLVSMLELVSVFVRDNLVRIGGEKFRRKPEGCSSDVWVGRKASRSPVEIRTMGLEDITHALQPARLLEVRGGPEADHHIGFRFRSDYLISPDVPPLIVALNEDTGNAIHDAAMPVVWLAAIDYHDQRVIFSGWISTKGISEARSKVVVTLAWEYVDGGDAHYPNAFRTEVVDHSDMRGSI